MLDAKLAATALDAALENLLNATVRYDRYGGACMAPLAGKTVAVHLTDLDRTVTQVLTGLASLSSQYRVKQLWETSEPRNTSEVISACSAPK